MDAQIFASLSDADLSRLRDDLVKALAQGADSIRFQDRDVKLRSREEMEGLIRQMKQDLERRSTPDAPPRRYRGFTLVGRRGY